MRAEGRRRPRMRSALPGAQAMTATADRHLPEEAATRVVPAVAPLAIDPVPEVRALRIDDHAAKRGC